MSVGPFGDGSFGTSEFSTAPFYNTKTLIDAVLRNSGHSNPAIETVKRASVLDFLNNRYSIITTSQDWDWLYQEVDFLIKGPYQDGTLSLVSQSETVTGIDTIFSSNVIPNNVLSLESRNETYLISSVESITSLTLESQFAGDTNTGFTYKIIKPIYTMPSDLDAVQSIQVDGISRELVPMGRQEFTRLKQSLPGLCAPPTCFSEIGRRSQDGVRLIEVYPAPDKNYTCRLMYGVNIQRLTDSEDSYPLVPDRHRAVLYYGSLSDMYAYLRDASMTERNENLFQQALLNMKNDTRITDSRIQFLQKRNYRNRTTSRRSRRRSISASDFAREE